MARDIDKTIECYQEKLEEVVRMATHESRFVDSLDRAEYDCEIRANSSSLDYFNKLVGDYRKRTLKEIICELVKYKVFLVKDFECAKRDEEIRSQPSRFYSAQADYISQRILAVRTQCLDRFNSFFQRYEDRGRKNEA